jgi:protein disulfide-isomerase-like protein
MKLKFNPEKMLSSRIKMIKNIFAPKNLPRLGLLLIVLAALYFLYKTFLTEPEGFEVESEELDDQIKDGTKLVLFYADWCGHCKNIKPIWEEAAKDVNAKENRMIKVNCGDGKDKDQEIMKKYKIDGYPTIIKFVNGTPKVYNGDRDADSFKNLFS